MSTRLVTAMRDAVAACLVCAAGALQGADRMWTGGGGTPAWSAAANWNGGTPPSAGDRPVFTGTAGLAADNDYAWNLSFGGLLFADTAGSFTVGGNPVVLAGDITNLSANAQTLSLGMTLAADRAVVAPSGEVRITGQLAGSGGLAKRGSGTVTLAGPNSYAGKTWVEAGMLVVTTAVPVALDRVGKPALWFDATDSATLTVNGGRVTTWSNKGSLSGMDAVVASGFTGPLLVNSSYAGGRQMLRIDGNSQGLVTSGNTGISGNASRTLFFVGYRAAGQTLLVHTGNSADNQAFGISDQTDRMYWYAYGSGRDITKAASAGNELHVYTFTADAVTNVREGFDNGVSYGTLNAALATADTPLYLGYRLSNTTTRGDIGEVIVYGRLLSADERKEVESYLLTKWQGTVQGTVVSTLPPNAAVEVASGATLRVDAGTAAVAALAGPAGAGVSLASGATLSLAATNAQTFDGTVSGGGRLVKRGNHSLTLGDANTYAGPTEVHAGSLIVGSLANGGSPSSLGAAPANSTNLILGAGTLRFQGSAASTDRGFKIASESANKASTLWVTNSVTVSGQVLCSCGSFIKSGPGTLTFAGAGENVFSANASYNPNAELNPGANGDAPSQGFSGLNVAEGKLVLGADGQTNRFAGEAFVGIRQASAKAAELEINGGMTTGTTWLAVGRGDGTNGLSSKITVNAGELVVQSFSMGYSVSLSNFWSYPVLNINGGSFRVRDIFYLSESAASTATVTVAGGTLRADSYIRFGQYAGAAGTLNLNGGTVETLNFARGSGAGYVRFNGGVLRPISSGQALQGMTETTVGAGGARIDTSLADFSVAQNLTHLSGLSGKDGGLTKLGGGVLTLSATGSTYDGNTTVSNGTLRLTGALPSASLLKVEAGAVFADARTGGTNTLGAAELAAGATYAPAPATLLQLNGTSFAADAGAALLMTNGTSQTFAFSGNLALGAPSGTPLSLVLDAAADGLSCDQLTTAGTLTLGKVNVNLRRSGTTFPFAQDGTLRLIACPSAQSPDLSGLALVNGAGGKTYTFSTVTDGSQKWVTLTIANDYAAATIWTNSVGGAWSADANWSVPPSGAPGSTVRLDGALATPSEISLDEASQSVGSLYFNNANAYTLAGTETLTFDNGGSAARAVVEKGAHVIDRPVTLAAGLDVEAAAGTQLALAKAVSGSGALRLTDAGTVLLTGTNLTSAAEVRAGTLKINDAGALGGAAAAVTLNGGALETTGSMTLGGAGQAALLVGAAGGTIRQPAGATLTLGGGTLSGAGTLAVENGTLVPGGAIAVGAYALNNLTFRNTTGMSLGIAQPVSLGGTLALDAAPADVALSGAISQTAGKGTTALTKRGPGALTVSGTGNWSSAGQRALVSVDEGTLRFTGASTNTIDADSGTSQTLYVGTAAGKQAVLRVDSGASLTLRNDLRAPAAAGATGAVEIAGGAVSAGWLSVAPTNNMRGVLRVSDGGKLLISRNAAEIGLAGNGSADSGALAHLDLRSGGTLCVTNGSGQNFQIGRYGAARVDLDGGVLQCRGWTCLGRFATGQGEINIQNGGLLEHGYENTGSGAFGVAELGKGVVNVLTGGTLRARYNFFLSLNNASTQRTVVNLWNGGFVEPNRLVPSASGSTVSNSVNFHGGGLRAYATNNTDFLKLRLSAGDASRAYVWPEGAVFDSNAKDVTVPEPLLAPGGQGVSSVAILSGGRYLTPPLLWISGGNGQGATASAVLDANGAITNVFITNPGVGYTAAPTVEIRGCAGDTPAVFGAVARRDNASGALRKLGAGILSLTGAGSTYTGETAVAAGTLKVAAGLLTGTAGFRVATNAVLDLAATAHTVGLLAGAGVITNGSVAVTNRLELGDAPGAVGTLKVFGNTTLAAQSEIRYDLAGSSSDRLDVTGDLTIGSGGCVDFGRTEADPLVTPFEVLAMTFTGSCANPSPGGVWHVRNSGRPNASLAATFTVRGKEVYLSVRYSGTLLTVR